MPTDQPRVVVTGMGAVTNLGHDAVATWSRMREGASGISLIEADGFDMDNPEWAVRIAGQVKDWDPTTRIDVRECKRLDRSSHLGIAAAFEAVEHAGIDFGTEDPERCGVCIGSGIGGIGTIEEGTRTLINRGPHRISPHTVPRLMVNAITGNVSIKYGLQGPASATATACASSGHAIADGLQHIRDRRADVMIVGGAEAAVTPLCIGAFMTMKALSTRNTEPTKASRPFDTDRDGFVLAEGAAMYVIESEEHAKARGAEILCELVSFGNSSDALHITAPDAKGRGAARSMKWALQAAKLNTDQIGYINAHGTSTPLGDRAEVAAVKSIFGEHCRHRLLMSSTKSMHGHSLGASGAIEMIACIHAVREGVVAPTINLDNPDEGMDLDLVAHEARERSIRYVMNNTFGFGGHNMTLIIGRYE